MAREGSRRPKLESLAVRRAQEPYNAIHHNLI
jgi:hypothetical protein